MKSILSPIFPVKTLKELVNLTASIENQTRVRVKFNPEKIMPFSTYNFTIYKSDDMETAVNSSNRNPYEGGDVIFDNLQLGTDYVIKMTSQYDGVMRIEEMVNVTTDDFQVTVVDVETTSIQLTYEPVSENY